MYQENLSIDITGVSSSTTVFHKSYTAEELCDVERDIYEACATSLETVPKDEDGFAVSTYTVTITRQDN